VARSELIAPGIDRRWSARVARWGSHRGEGRAPLSDRDILRRRRVDRANAKPQLYATRPKALFQ
jgi:hypothetical protein